MTAKRFTETVSTGIVTDHVTGKEYSCEMRIDDKLLELLNELHKENKRLKSDLARVIEQARKNDEFCRSDIRILEKALWCPNCANDIKRLKELRKEFLE